MSNPAERLIVALDFPDGDSAERMARTLTPEGVGFKVGLELYTAGGPALLDRLRTAGASRFFLDLKFHDIPNTMAGAARAAARLGVWMLNVHASAGSAAMRRAAEAAAEGAGQAGVARPLVIAVTVLTSLDGNTLRDELGVSKRVEDQVTSLARLTRESGLDGVVAPAEDAGRIRAACGHDFCIVSPGIRPKGQSADDQARINTPGQAIAGGSDYLVVGRPITQADDPLQSCREILREIAEAPNLH